MAVPGILSVHGTNARYFKPSGWTKPIVLAGFHTWYDVIDGGSSDPPSAFDWNEYLTALRDYGCNFTKLWMLETAENWSGGFEQYFTPNLYDRTGPGNANDGKLKFDLTSIDSDWLDRLYNRALACQNAGIYVCIQLFQGWQIDLSKGGADNPWTAHPYELANNINTLDGDQDDDGEGSEIHEDTVDNVVESYQDDLIEAIVDRLNGLDNVIYEISNEDSYNADTLSWQELRLSHLDTYQGGEANQHLIGMTRFYPDHNDSYLSSSSADWVSYEDLDNVDGTKVSCSDTDHVYGITSNYDWIWISLCGGHGGMWYMDEWDGALYGSDRRENATYQHIRATLGYAVRFAYDFMDLAAMTPQPAKTSASYCLTSARRGKSEFLIFADAGGTFTVDLSDTEAIFQVIWLKATDGTRQAGTDTKGGSATQNFTSPFGAVASVLYLRGELVDDNADGGSESWAAGVRITTTTQTTTYTQVEAPV